MNITLVHFNRVPKLLTISPKKKKKLMMYAIQFYFVNWSVFVWDCVKEISGKEYVIQFVVGWIRLDNICCIFSERTCFMIHYLSLQAIFIFFNFGYCTLMFIFFFASNTHLSRSSITTVCWLKFWVGEKEPMISWLSVHKKNWQVVVFTQCWNKWNRNCKILDSDIFWCAYRKII